MEQSICPLLWQNDIFCPNESTQSIFISMAVIELLGRSVSQVGNASQEEGQSRTDIICWSGNSHSNKLMWNIYTVQFSASRDPVNLIYLDAQHLHLSAKQPSAPIHCNPFQVAYVLLPIFKSLLPQRVWDNLWSSPSCFKHTPAPHYAGWEVLAC